ncbi:MAG: hypothetical protein HYZ52_04765 [Candidatus Omnitrophica bacterium]|nr:hypothetical protein [Candidatus Omnitrophota bacterium]
MISAGLLIYATAAPFFLPLAQVLIYRLWSPARNIRSHQLFLVRLTLYLNAPVLAGAAGLAHFEGKGLAETFWMVFFAGVVFNSFGYAYFHLFNLSETGRRVRFLIMIRQGRSRPEELEKEYSPEDMVRARVERLVHLRHIRRAADGGWRVESGVLLFAARVLRAWRKLYGWETA